MPDNIEVQAYGKIIVLTLPSVWSERAIKHAPKPKSLLAQTGAKGAPNLSPAIKGIGAGAKARHSLLWDRSEPAQIPCDAQPEHAKKKALSPAEIIAQARTEIEEVRSAVSDLSLDLADLDEILAPVRFRKISIEGLIREAASPALALDACQVAARRPLWAALLDISETHGRDFTRRRECDARIKSMVRHIQHLEGVIKHTMKRKSYVAAS